MTHEKITRLAEPRCDNCCFSTFATGTGRAALICRQKKGSVGNWNIRSPLDKCPNFYPSRLALRSAYSAEAAVKAGSSATEGGYFAE